MPQYHNVALCLRGAPWHPGHFIYVSQMSWSQWRHIICLMPNLLARSRSPRCLAHGQLRNSLCCISMTVPPKEQGICQPTHYTMIPRKNSVSPVFTGLIAAKKWTNRRFNVGIPADRTVRMYEIVRRNCANEHFCTGMRCYAERSAMTTIPAQESPLRVVKFTRLKRCCVRASKP